MIRFGAEVVRASPRPGGCWEIGLAGGQVEAFDHLMVCNGHHWLPRWPAYPGRFAGPLIHSHQFKTSAPFLGQRVLVIGGGNSACDIAVEDCRVAEHVGISWRRGYYVIPKLVFGTPPDLAAAGIAGRWDRPAAIKELTKSECRRRRCMSAVPDTPLKSITMNTLASWSGRFEPGETGTFRMLHPETPRGGAT